MANQLGDSPFYLLLKKWQLFIHSEHDSSVRQVVFKEIWEKYHKRLLFFIMSLVKDEAEDLLQEIMLKVYNNLEKFNPLYSFNTWIYTIARNHCYNYLEKKKLPTLSIQAHEFGKNRLDGIPLVSRETPEEILNQEEVFQKIDRYLGKLNPIYQQIAFLRFYEGMKIKAIAQILNLPAGTVKSRLHLLQKELKKELEDN